jgi:hypothetical protein
MSYARQMLLTCPPTVNVDAELLAGTIDALNDCNQACMADTSCDLREENVAEMVECALLCLDCANVCIATAAVISRQTDGNLGVIAPLLEACVAACQSCGDECERHAPMHGHCRVCAEACQSCERACRDMLGALR